MEIILDLLKRLSTSLSPVEFVTTLSVIALTSYFLVSYFIRQVRAKSGIWSFLDAPEEEHVELKDVHAAVEQLSINNGYYHEESLTAHRAVLAAVQELRVEDRERAETILRYLEEIAKLESFVQITKDSMLEQIAELQHHVKSHQLLDGQEHAIVRLSLDSAVQALSKINIQLEKMDEYMKSAVPEFKTAHRELSKDISSLSRDIALVERSIHSQISNVNAIKLR